MKHFEISRQVQETPNLSLNDALIMSRDWNTHISDNTLIAVGSKKGAAHVFSKTSADFDSFCECLLNEVQANENPRSYEYDEVVGYLVSGMDCMEISCARPGEINIAVDPRNREYLKIIDNKIQIMKRDDNNIDYHVSYEQELSDVEMKEFKKNITRKVKFIQSYYDSIKNVHFPREDEKEPIWKQALSDQRMKIFRNHIITSENFIQKFYDDLKRKQ